MDDTALRQDLLNLLRGGNAHVAAADALNHLDLKFSTVRPEGMEHSVWELLEHVRIAQEDILRYTLDASWKSPKWPEGYWPTNPPALSKKAWNDSVSSFKADLESLIRLAENRDLDLTSRIPHGEGRTYLRQLLLAADHNSYHLGQIILVRKALGQWSA